MRILLTGAFGNVGLSALEELLARGHQVRCFDLKTSANVRLARHYARKAEIFWGDLRSKDDVAAAVRDVDVVIHLAFILPRLSACGVELEKEPVLARQVNVGGTRNLIRAMRAQPVPPRLIFSSSLHVYGMTQHLPPPRTGGRPAAPGRALCPAQGHLRTHGAHLRPALEHSAFWRRAPACRPARSRHVRCPVGQPDRVCAHARRRPGAGQRRGERRHLGQAAVDRRRPCLPAHVPRDDDLDLDGHGHRTLARLGLLRGTVRHGLA